MASCMLVMGSYRTAYSSEVRSPSPSIPSHVADMPSYNSTNPFRKILFSTGLITLLTLILFTGPANAGWLPRPIHEVRAYVYDYTQEKDNDALLRNRKLHKGIINDGGAKLSDDQIKRLKDAIRSSEERVPGAFCYMPHHGFVFFDKNGTPMGHIELCFQCGNVSSSPKGLPEKEWNWKELRKLLKELDIPILESDQEYTDLFKNKAEE